ncbi:hypothetical protein [Yinghuangia seranimata]|uniref:hypothetical protein n=1 Tax=Yinghuangia seranimata TaxID=408067 RepID=UPI00248B1B0F|nr:hypothetical protein [Yinghuangia seranimata]MDI2125026.1 hypothetical protein [Yinghuangia seranimata]
MSEPHGGVGRNYFARLRRLPWGPGPGWSAFGREGGRVVPAVAGAVSGERRGGRLSWAAGARHGGDSEPAKSSGGSPPRWRICHIAVALALPLYVGWGLLLATGGGDLAAQYSWAEFAVRHPGTPYGLFWYGGVDVGSYSVLSPPLMALAGVRTLAALSGLTSTWLLAALLVRTTRKVPTWPALIGALALWANVVSGRATFALGVASALGTLLVLVGRHTPVWRLVVGGVGTGLTVLFSPVAGLFLLVAGAGYLLDRQWARGLALTVPTGVVGGLVAALFPSHGQQPMGAERIILPVLTGLVVALTAPRDWRVLRAGGAVYAVGVVLTWLIPSPVGTNVERLGALLGAPVLLAIWYERRRRAPQPATRSLLRFAGDPSFGTRFCAAGLAMCVIWTTVVTARDALNHTEVPGWSRHTAGVIAELDRLGAYRGRVEVVPTGSHREAPVFAQYFQAVRGWNRQLDMERGRLFYSDELDEASYRAWLNDWAVGYVVLPHAPPDGYAETEAALIRSGRLSSWLNPVWSDTYWTVFRVQDAVPLATAPAEVLRAGDADIVLEMPSPGTVTVRAAYSHWLYADGACLRASGPWIQLTASRPGTYRITSSYFPPDGCRT